MCIQVEDWGVGFDVKTTSAAGFGLKGIRQRARLPAGQVGDPSSAARTITTYHPDGDPHCFSSNGFFSHQIKSLRVENASQPLHGYPKDRGGPIAAADLPHPGLCILQTGQADHFTLVAVFSIGPSDGDAAFATTSSPPVKSAQ
jgi:hypothetical protein